MHPNCCLNPESYLVVLVKFMITIEPPIEDPWWFEGLSLSHSGRETDLGVIFSNRRQGLYILHFLCWYSWRSLLCLLHHRSDTCTNSTKFLQARNFPSIPSPKRAMNQESQTSKMEEEKGKEKRKEKKRSEWIIL